MMRNYLQLVALLLLAGCWEEPVPSPPVDRPPEGLPEQPGETIASDSEWELAVTYRNKGSRSEGQHGTLLHNGVRIKAGEIGDLIETPLGQMKFYGTKPEMPWGTTGWHFADPEKKTPSWAE